MSDMAGSVAGWTGLGECATEGALDAVFEAVAEALAKEEAVRIAWFGNFATRYREVRNRQNPRTGKSNSIPALTALSFEAGNALKATFKEAPAARDRVTTELPRWSGFA